MSAFRTPDLRKKLLFVLGIIALFRLGSVVPTPGVDYTAVQSCLDQVQENPILGLVNLFSGGALLQLSVFALGIMPYITASIIMQLLTVVIPRLESLKQEGQSGNAKITQYTRYLTIGLSLLQSTSILTMARTPGRLLPGCNQDLIPDESIFLLIVMVFVLTAGTSLIMWLAELVTDKGVGNGMSVLIFTSIIATFPGQLVNIWRTNGIFTFALTLGVGIITIMGVVFVEQAQRRVPVQYAKRMVGRRQYGGTSTYIPLKVNMAGVVPVIFASSLLYIPSLIVNLSGSTAGWAQWIASNLTKGEHPLYMAHVRHADRVLHVLLRCDHVQPEGNGRQLQELRRLHPRHPRRKPNRGVPCLRDLAPDGSGIAVPRSDRDHPARGLRLAGRG